MPPSHSFTASPRAVPNVVTTTVFAGGAPTADSAGSSSSGHSSLPIGAIVGGLVAGAFLSLAAVGIWVWWGRSLEKKRRKQPRLRSALKKNGGRSTPSVNASKHSLPRHHPAMASASQKSVSFAPVPSPRTSEDSDLPQTPSPAASSDMSNSEDRDKGKQTPRTALREQGQGATSPPTATWPRSSPTPPRSALRAPSSLRGPSTERAYAPARPSPLAHATHAPPSTRTPRPPTPNAHPVPDAQLPSPAQDDLAPPRQLTGQPADRSSGASVPSEYSQEGTASDVDPQLRMLRAPDGRLYPLRETDELSRSASSLRTHGDTPAGARIR